MSKKRTVTIVSPDGDAESEVMPSSLGVYERKGWSVKDEQNEAEGSDSSDVSSQTPVNTPEEPVGTSWSSTSALTRQDDEEEESPYENEE